MLKPTGNRVLIKLIDVEEVTKNGIFIPEAAREESQIGEIVAISEAIERNFANDPDFPLYQVGAKIIFAKYAASPIKVGETPRQFIKTDDIMGVLQ